MPYRIDLRASNNDDALDRLIELGALDVESTSGHQVAAVMPDSVTANEIARALGVDDVRVSPAIGRDNHSVWVLRPRPIHIGSLRIVPAGLDAEPGDLKLIDAPAFGTGFHPTTALCLEALEEIVNGVHPDSTLDVGTGSGVLALAALRHGVPRALALDLDDQSLRAAADNARLNGLDARLQLACGGPETVTGTWPLVVANILAAPLIEMAPALVRRVGHHGQLVLSGIPGSVEPDVTRAYVHAGMRRSRVTSRDAWVCFVFQASW
jgi:ribosomal protein L11 methyltransferase